MNTFVALKKLKMPLLLVSLIISASLSWSDEASLLPPDLLDAIIQEVSGEIALQNEIMLAPFERTRDKEEFVKQFWESSYIQNKAKEYGLQNVQLYTFSSDDPLWQADVGELWQLEPKKRKIADIKEIAASLAIGSCSTDIEAELVYMEKASRLSDFEGKDVSGKIILTADEIKAVQRIGMKEKGAAGVVSYASYTPFQYIDTVGWQWGLSKKEEKTEELHRFGFSVSRRIGNELKDLLLEGEKVVVRAKIESTFYPGRDEVVTAIIPGSDLREEEFVLVAHLFEDISKQGANDNNSGSACILEVGRCIVKLISEGKIAPPRRTIRFLWVPEYSGTIKFLENYPEIAKRMISGINMDMVGCNLYKNNSPFHIYRTPYSIPSYINYVAENLMDYAVNTNRVSIEGRPYDTIVATSGSRQNFMCWMDEFDSDSDSDIFNVRQVNVPMVFFCNWTDDFYHSSEDAPKNSDATQLKRAGFLGAAIALAIAKADDLDVLAIVADSLARIRSRLALCTKKAYNLLYTSGKYNIADMYKKCENLIRQSSRVELKGLVSCASLSENNTDIMNYIHELKDEVLVEKEKSLAELQKYYHILCQMRGIEPEPTKLTEVEKRLAKLIPVVSTEEVWPPIQKTSKGLKIFDIRNAAYEAFNFIDGKQSIKDIFQALDAEFIDEGGISAEVVEEFMRALEKAELIKIETSS
jgi:aminopeptidase YwaD